MKNVSILIFLAMGLLSRPVQSQTIVSVDPDSAFQCQKLTITVTGENTNFHQGTSTIRLQRAGSNSIYSWMTTVQSETELEGVFFFNPDHDPGYYDVITPDLNDEIILQDGFFLSPVTNPPVIHSTNPDTSFTGQYLNLEIVGRHTHFAQGVNQQVWLYSSEVAETIQEESMEIINDTLLRVGFDISSYATPGTYALFLRDQLDSELSLPGALVLLPIENSPDIVSVIPDEGYQGTALTVTVTGKNTEFQQGTSTLYLSMFGYPSISPYHQSVINDTVLSGDFIFSSTEVLGIYDVVVHQYGGGSIIKESAFQLHNGGNAPFLESVDPRNTNQGTKVKLLIKAVNTQFTQPGNGPSVTLTAGYEELYCHDIVIIDSVNLEANYIFSHANTLGLYDLVVYTPLDGTMRLEQSFELLESTNMASIVAVNPDSTMLGQSLTIQVTGKDIIFMQGTSQLMLSRGNISLFPSNQTIVNDTVISGEFDFQTTLPDGLYDVQVDNGYAWPSVILTDGFMLKLFDFMEETNFNSFLSFYPNPAKDILYVKRNMSNSGDFSIQVFDMHGQLVLEDQLLKNTAEKQLNLKTLKKGTYVLSVSYGSSIQTDKFVIQ